jgi:type II secretory pathway component HofQ
MIFEGSPEVLATLGIGSTPAGGAAGFAALDPEGSKALLERLRKTDGIDVLSAPRIVTGGGNEAQVSIGNDTGGHLNLSVVPNLAPDGNVDLRLKVSRSEGTGQP